MGKVKEILSYASLTVGIISGILAILERLTNWGMLGLLYPLIGQGTLFWLLLVVALTFLTACMIGARRSHTGFFFTVKSRPTSLKTRDYYETKHYDVLWREYPPTAKSHDQEAWIEGPYCPKCKRELEEATTGTLRKKPVWVCSNCEKEYERPKGDPKEEIRKDFEAYLRRKSEL
jgi:ribosomal protein L37AE/L43A